MTKLAQQRDIVAGISNSLEKYFTYFDELLQDDFLLTADVSPSYMPIQAADLRAVIDAFNAKGVAVCVVFWCGILSNDCCPSGVW